MVKSKEPFDPVQYRDDTLGLFGEYGINGELVELFRPVFEGGYIKIPASQKEPSLKTERALTKKVLNFLTGHHHKAVQEKASEYTVLTTPRALDFASMGVGPMRLLSHLQEVLGLQDSITTCKLVRDHMPDDFEALSFSETLLLYAEGYVCGTETTISVNQHYINTGEDVLQKYTKAQIDNAHNETYGNTHGKSFSEILEERYGSRDSALQSGPG
jgi:hypothetical protein